MGVGVGVGVVRAGRAHPRHAVSAVNILPGSDTNADKTEHFSPCARCQECGRYIPPATDKEGVIPMNESTNHRVDDPDPGIHDATKALQDLADEVEHERAEHGRSSVDPVVLTDGVALAETIDHGGDATTDDAPGHATDPSSPLAPIEPGTDGTIRPVPTRAQMPH